MRASLISFVVLFAVVGCGRVAAPPPPTVDVPATVDAQVQGTVTALSTVVAGEARQEAQRRADATVQSFTRSAAPTAAAVAIATIQSQALATLAAKPTSTPLPTATPKPAPTVAAEIWALTYDSLEPSDVRIVSNEYGQTRVQHATGQFLRLHFRLKNLQPISASVPTSAFVLADAQGRSYTSDFEVRQDLPDGSSQAFGGASVAPGTTVGLNLSFDVPKDAKSLVLHMAGANDVSVN